MSEYKILKDIRDELKELNEKLDTWNAFHVEDLPKGVKLYEQKQGDIRVRVITGKDVEFEYGNSVKDDYSIIDLEDEDN